MSSQHKPFEVPILFIIFSRPETTKVVFEGLRKLKPTSLFIACDGPRSHKPEDPQKIAESKEIVAGIDWPCDVKTLYRTENLGCGKGPAQAIDWFFTHVKEGIILEDDCVPSDSFFTFCGEMLDRYRNDEQVMHISGTNFQDGIKRGSSDYYFSVHQHCWGWATWKRAWERFDYDMKDYPEFVKKKSLKYISHRNQITTYWNLMLEEVFFERSVDIWDYQWSYWWHQPCNQQMQFIYK